MCFRLNIYIIYILKIKGLHLLRFGALKHFLCNSDLMCFSLTILRS